MMDFIKTEYLWFIGIILAIYGILQTWRINKLNARKRNISLFYKIKTNVSFNNLHENITICYNEENYDRICFAELILGNNGNVNLVKSDISDSVKIITDSPIKILSHKVIESSNNEGEISIVLKSSSNSDFLEVNFNQMLTKESVKFYILFVPQNSNINFRLRFLYNNEGRLDSKTVSNVSYYDNPAYHGRDYQPLGCLIIFAYLAFLYFSFVSSQKLVQNLLQNWLNFTLVSSEIVSFFVATLPAIFISFLIYIVIKKDIFKLNKKSEERQSPFGRGFNLNK